MEVPTTFHGRHIKEEITWPLYDYQKIGQHPNTDMDFFQCPVGVMGKTQRDTNMWNAGCLPFDNVVLVTGIRVLFFPDWPQHRLRHKKDEQDMRRVLLDGSLEFVLQNRVYLHDGPLAKFPAGFHYIYEKPAFVTRGLRGKLAKWRMFGELYKVVPLFIQHNQCFRVRLSGLPGYLNSPGRIGVILDGRMVRP